MGRIVVKQLEREWLLALTRYAYEPPQQLTIFNRGLQVESVEDTLGVLENLKTEGKIRAYGVSNFGRQDLGKCVSSQKDGARPPRFP